MVPCLFPGLHASAVFTIAESTYLEPLESGSHAAGWRQHGCRIPECWLNFRAHSYNTLLGIAPSIAGASRIDRQKRYSLRMLRFTASSLKLEPRVVVA